MVRRMFLYRFEIVRVRFILNDLGGMCGYNQIVALVILSHPAEFQLRSFDGLEVTAVLVLRLCMPK